MMDKIQIGEYKVREDLLYAYLQAVENVAEGRDVWRLDTERATHHHTLLKSIKLTDTNRKKYKEFAASLSTWIEKQMEKDRRKLDGNFRQ